MLIGEALVRFSSDATAAISAMKAVATEAGKIATTAEGQNKQTTKSFENIASAGSTLAGNILRYGTVIGGSMVAIGAFAVKSAGDYQQNRIAFETMLGSADKARTLLKQVSDFAAQTPFQLPQVVEGAKNLLAFGIEAKNIIPTFNMLGNIAAGVGTDKLPGLIAVFGQVRAAGRLMTQDLLQFTSAGVPVLDLLAEHFHTTTKGVQDMIQKGKVSFDDLNASLALLGGPGGKWGDLMAKQSLTFQGTMSNLSDIVGRVARSMVGLTAQGDVVKGGLFEKLSTAANQLLDWLTKNQDMITAVATNIVQNLVTGFMKLVAVIIEVVGWIKTHQTEAKALLAVVGGFMVFLLIASAIMKVVDAFKLLHSALMAIGAMSKAEGVIALTSFGWILLVVALVALLAYEIYTHWDQIKKWTQDLAATVTKWFEGLKNDVKKQWEEITKFFSNMWADMKRLAQEGVKFLIDAIIHFPENLAYVLGMAAGYIYVFFTKDIPAAWATFINFMESIPGRVEATAKAMWSAVTTWYNKTKDDSIKAAKDTVDGVEAWFKALPGRVSSAANSLWSSVQGAWASFKTNSVNFAKQTADEVVNWFSSLPGRIKDAVTNGLKSAGNFFSNIGSSLTSGFKHALGIPGFATGVQNFIGGLAIVGEQGPELVKLPQGSSVLTNQDSRQLVQGAGQQKSGDTKVTNNNFNIEVGHFLGTPQEMRAFAENINRELIRLNNARSGLGQT